MTLHGWKVFLAFAWCLSSSGAHAQLLHWASSIAGNDLITITGSAVDDSNNLIVAGIFTGNLNLDPQRTSHVLTTTSPADAYVAKYLPNGDLVWTLKFGNVNAIDLHALTIDENGNIILSGKFQGTVDFNPGSDIFELTSATTQSAFILKLNSKGSFVWAKSFGRGTANDLFVTQLAADDNDIIASGIFKTKMDFNPGTGVNEFTPQGVSAIFIEKFDENGNMIWVKTIDGPEGEYLFDMFLDKNDNLYLSGEVSGDVDFDPGAGTSLKTLIGNEDGYVLQLTKEGEFVDVMKFGATNGSVSMFNVVADRKGNIYVNGSFSGDLDFDPGPAAVIKTGYLQNFTASYDSSSQLKWVHLPDVNSTVGYLLSLDASDNVLVGGIFKDSTDLDPSNGRTMYFSNGANDFYVQQLNASGELLSALSIGGVGNESLTDIVSDHGGNIFLTGYFSDTVDFDPQSGVSNLISVIDPDIFISRLLLPYTGIDLISDRENGAIFYPNPTNGILYCRTDLTDDNGKVTLYDLQGRILIQQQVEFLPEFSVDLSELDNGMYILSIETVHKSYSSRIVKG